MRATITNKRTVYVGCYLCLCHCVLVPSAGGYVDFTSLRDMTRLLASNNPQVQVQRSKLRSLALMLSELQSPCLGAAGDDILGCMVCRPANDSTNKPWQA